jgi:hypothetical protein
MMADRENVRLWVDALRSGKYEQGRNYLAKDGQYCCLGVACEVSIANGLNLRVILQAGGTKAYDSSDTTLPLSVVHWLGVDKSSPSVTMEHGYSRELAQLNDAGETFQVIADLIEREWLTEEDEAA